MSDEQAIKAEALDKLERFAAKHYEVNIHGTPEHGYVLEAVDGGPSAQGATVLEAIEAIPED